MTDQETPTWREAALTAVRLSVEDEYSRQPNRNFRVRVPLQWVKLMQKAARSRGMSTTGYMRRAIMSWVSHDLNMDWFELMEDEPNVAPGRPAASNPHVFLGGEGFGAWRIVEATE